jgi:PAS domain S-box-containing protein
MVNEQMGPAAGSGPPARAQGTQTSQGEDAPGGSTGNDRPVIEEMRRRLVKLEAENAALQADLAALRLNRDRYASLYDLSPMGHLVVQEQNIIAEANLTMCRLLGVDRPALTGTKLTGWLKQASRARFYQHRKSVLKGGARQGCELVMVRPDGTEFLAMAESAPVEASQGWLTMAVTDISHRKKTEEEMRLHKERLTDMIRQRTGQLSELARRLVEVQEKERSNIAKELHDEVGQLLTYAGLLIDKAASKPQPEMMAEAKTVIQDAVARLRNLSATLSPPLLHNAGILEALESLFEDYTRHTQIKVTFNHEVSLDGLSANLALVVYRIVQEALTNVARHAQAARVNVRISPRGRRLRIQIRDDGVGFDPKEVKKSTGLSGMRERALALGGEIIVDSGPGKGTRIIATLPVS